MFVFVKQNESDTHVLHFRRRDKNENENKHKDTCKVGTKNQAQSLACNAGILPATIDVVCTR